MDKKEKSIYSLLGGPFWILNKDMVKALGIEDSLWLADIFSKWKYFEEKGLLDKEGYFFNTQKNIQEDTTLSGHKQTEITKRLKEKGLLKIKFQGLPARNFYKIDTEKLLELLEKQIEKQASDIGGPSDPNIKSLATQNVGDIIRIKGNENKGNKSSLNKGEDPFIKKGSEIPPLTDESKPLKRKIRSERLREEVQIFYFWNTLGKPLSIHRDDTKIYRNGLDECKKKLLQHSVDNIKSRIRQYHSLLVSPDTTINLNVPGHRVGFDEFFRFSDNTKNRMAKQKVDLDIKSWFDECAPDLDPLGKYVKVGTPDDHPVVTRVMKKTFVNKVLGGTDPKEWSVRDEECFRRASIRLIGWFDDNKKRVIISEEERRYPNKLGRYLFAALEAKMNGSLDKITPGWLCSDIMFKRTLPAYLHEQAMIRE